MTAHDVKPFQGKRCSCGCGKLANPSGFASRACVLKLQRHEFGSTIAELLIAAGKQPHGEWAKERAYADYGVTQAEARRER